MSTSNKNIEGLLSGNHRYRKSQFPLLPITGDSSAVTLPKLADNPTLVSTTESEQKLRARRNKSKSRKTSTRESARSRPNKKTRKPRQDASRDHQPRTAGTAEKGGHESRARHRTSAQKTPAPKSAERPRRHVSLPARTEADIENAKLKAMMRDLSAQHQVEPRAAPARLHARHVTPISNSPYASSVSRQSSKASSRQSRDIAEAVTLFKEMRGEMAPHQETDTIDKARLQDYEHHYKQLVHEKTKRATSLNTPLRTHERPRPRNISCDDYSHAKPRYLPPLEDMKKEYEKYSRTISKVKTSKTKAAEDGEVAEKKVVKKKKILKVRHTKKSQQMQANMKKKTEASNATQFLADTNASAPNSARHRSSPIEEKAKKTTTSWGKDVVEHYLKSSRESAAERRARVYAPKAASRAVSSTSEAASVSSVKSSHVNVAVIKKKTKVAGKMPAQVDIKLKDPSNAIKSKKTTTSNVVPKAKASVSQVSRVSVEKKTRLSTADKTKVSSAEKTKVSTGVSRVSTAEKNGVSSSASRVSSAATSRLSSAKQSRIPVLSAQKNRVSSAVSRVSSGVSRVSSGVSRVSSAEKSRVLSAEKSRISSAEKSRVYSAEKTRLSSAEKTRVSSAEKTRVSSAEKTRVNSAEKSRASSASPKASESYDKDSFYSDTNSISSARSTRSTKALEHTAKPTTPSSNKLLSPRKSDRASPDAKSTCASESSSRTEVIKTPRERSNPTSRTSGLKAYQASAVSTAKISSNHRNGSAHSDRISPSRASHRASRDSVAGKATSRPGTAVSARSSSPLGPDRPPSGYTSPAVQKSSTSNGHADDDRASRRSSRSSRPASSSVFPADAGQFGPTDDRTSDRPPSGTAGKAARASASRAEIPSSPRTRAASPENAIQNRKSPTSSSGQRSSRASVAPDKLSSRSSQSVSRASATGDHIARDDIITSQRKRSPSPHRPCSKRASKTDRRTPRANSTTEESSPRPMTGSPDRDCLKTTRAADPRAYDAIDAGSVTNSKSPDRLSSRRGSQGDARASGSGQCSLREDVASPVRRKSATSDSAVSPRRISQNLSRTSLGIDSTDVPKIDAEAESSSRASKASAGPDGKRARPASSRASTAHSRASRDDVATTSHRKRSPSPCEGYREGSCTTLNSPQDMSKEPSHSKRSSRNSRRSHAGSRRDQSPSTTTRSHAGSRRDQSPSTTTRSNAGSRRDQSPSTTTRSNAGSRRDQSPSTTTRSHAGSRRDQSPSTTTRSHAGSRRDQSPSTTTRSNAGSHRDQSPSTTTRSHAGSRRDQSPSTTPRHDEKSARSQASATDVSEHIKARPPSGRRASSRPKSSSRDTVDAMDIDEALKAATSTTSLKSEGNGSPSSVKRRSISRHSQEILPDITTPREYAAKYARSTPRSVSPARSVSSSSTRTVTPAAQTYNCQEILAASPRETQAASLRAMSAASQGAKSATSQRAVSVVDLTAEEEAIQRFSQRAMSAASQRMSVASQRAMSAASQRVMSADSQKSMTTAIQRAMSATSKALSAASGSVTSLPRADALMTFEAKSPRDSLSGQTVRTPL